MKYGISINMNIMSNSEDYYEELQNNMDEYGKCPNCGAIVHISEMGDKNGTTCCVNCYQSLIDENNEE